MTNYRRQKPKATWRQKPFVPPTIALPAPRHSWLTVWADLSPAERAQLAELGETADLALALPSGSHLGAILDLIARDKNEPEAEPLPTAPTYTATVAPTDDRGDLLWSDEEMLLVAREQLARAYRAVRG